MTSPTARRRPGDEPLTLVHNGRPSAPTTDDRLDSIDARLDRLEGLVREALGVLADLSARLDRAEV